MSDYPSAEVLEKLAGLPPEWADFFREEIRNGRLTRQRQNDDLLQLERARLRLERLKILFAMLSVVCFLAFCVYLTERGHAREAALVAQTAIGSVVVAFLGAQLITNLSKKWQSE